MCPYEDYCLDVIMRLPNVRAVATAVFNTMELQVTTFFSLCLIKCAVEFSEIYIPLCFRCLHLDLIA